MISHETFTTLEEIFSRQLQQWYYDVIIFKENYPCYSPFGEDTINRSMLNWLWSSDTYGSIRNFTFEVIGMFLNSCSSTRPPCCPGRNISNDLHASVYAFVCEVRHLFIAC